MKKIACIALLLLSLGLNVFLLYRYKTSTKLSVQLQESKEYYPLVNPSTALQIDSNVQSSNLILHYQELKPLVVAEIEKVATGNVGIFLQDAKTGAWMGVNEQMGFVPASLLKVPLMMAMLKRVERGEVSLDDTIKLTEEDLNDGSGGLYQQGAGKELTTQELLKWMILSSDNTAKNAIKRQLLPVEINAVFAHVGIENPYSSTSSQEVTPRGYSRIFKSLYFSSFLSPELSQHALDLTTDTQVESLISAGVPSEVQVAHKYGERSNGLTDCGIVYHPRSPYYLCVMTKDVDATAVKNLIMNISSTVYAYVDSR